MCTRGTILVLPYCRITVGTRESGLGMAFKLGLPTRLKPPLDTARSINSMLVRLAIFFAIVLLDTIQVRASDSVEHRMQILEQEMQALSQQVETKISEAALSSELHPIVRNSLRTVVDNDDEFNSGHFKICYSYMDSYCLHIGTPNDPNIKLIADKPDYRGTRWAIFRDQAGFTFILGNQHELGYNETPFLSDVGGGQGLIIDDCSQASELLGCTWDLVQASTVEDKQTWYVKNQRTQGYLTLAPFIEFPDQPKPNTLPVTMSDGPSSSATWVIRKI